MLHLQGARSSFFFYFNFIVFFFVRKVFFVLFSFFCLHTPRVFLFTFRFFWSIPEHNYKYKHIHHYDYLLQLPSTTTKTRQRNADTIESHRQADADIHSHKRKQMHSQQIRESQSNNIQDHQTCTTNYYYYYYKLLLSHTMIQEFLKLSNRIWTLKKIHFVCPIWNVREGKQICRKERIEGKGKGSRFWEKANDMMIHFPLFKQ